MIVALLKSVVTLFLVLMHTRDHFITLNCLIQVDHLAESKIKRLCV